MLEHYCNVFLATQTLVRRLAAMFCILLPESHTKQPQVKHFIVRFTIGSFGEGTRMSRYMAISAAA